MSAVLVVDDIPEALDVMVATMRNEGHQVFSAATREAALDSLQSTTFDLVIVDLSLVSEGVDEQGLDVLEAVHAKDSTIPVIVVTSYGSLARGVSVMLHGAFDYIDRKIPGVNSTRLIREKAKLALECRRATLESQTLAA